MQVKTIPNKNHEKHNDNQTKMENGKKSNKLHNGKALTFSDCKVKSDMKWSNNIKHIHSCNILLQQRCHS